MFAEHECEADTLGGLVFPSDNEGWARDRYGCHSAILSVCGKPAYLQLPVEFLDGSFHPFWLCFDHYEQWTGNWP